MSMFITFVDVLKYMTIALSEIFDICFPQFIVKRSDSYDKQLYTKWQ